MRDKLASLFRRMRRRLAKRIEPSEPEPDPAWDIPIDISLRGAAALRQVLGVDEESYLRVAGQSWTDPRSYVLYTGLDEVKKSAMYLMRIRELLDGPDVSPFDDRLSRLLVTHVLEEQQARVRRLLEVLVLLVLFEATNEQEYYRHLLLVEELNDLLSSNMDLEEFYGARSANIDDSIDRQIDWIREVEGQLDLQRCWYLRARRPLMARDRLRPGQILSNVRTRIREAIPSMTDSERLLFGFSYGGMYGQTSEAVHYSAKRDDFRLRTGSEYATARELGLLNFAILDRCHLLLGRPTVPILDRLRSNLERSDAAKITRAATVRETEVGDFVLAYGDLAEVLEVRESRYAYRSYRVRYLAERPKPDIQEDWFPAMYVRLFHTRSRFFSDLERMVDEGRLPPDVADQMGALDADTVQTILRDSLVEAWMLGLRDWVRKQDRESAD